MRLNVFIARSGICSRRGADILIKEGKVKVNGIIVKDPWRQVDKRSGVEVEGKVIAFKDLVYILFFKPKGVVTTLKDRFAKHKIIDFIPAGLKGVFSIGRLDKESEGLLLLTNDGNLCYRLTHPKFRVEKEYLLEIKGSLSPKDLKVAKQGVWVDGDFLKVEKASIKDHYKNKTEIRVVICEGKKRHLRRLFGRLGFKVLELKRIRIANLRLGRLKPGEFKILERETIYKNLVIKS